MKSNNLQIFLVILGVAAPYALGSTQGFTYAEVDLEGSCPKIRAITNLDLNTLCGWWYRAFNTLTNPLCYNEEGHTIYAAPYNETALNFVACCRSAANPDTPACGDAIGTGYVLPGSNPGEFIYKFGSSEYILYSIDTDYVNFNLVYGCRSGNNAGRDEQILVLSRHYELSTTVLDRIRDVLKRNGSSLSNVKAVKQGPSIPYTPNTRPCSSGN